MCLSDYVFMCLSDYVFMCLSDYVFIWLCVFVFIWLCVHVFMCLCVYLIMCLSDYVFMCFCVFVFLCLCVYVFMCFCVYVMYFRNLNKTVYISGNIKSIKKAGKWQIYFVIINLIIILLKLGLLIKCCKFFQTTKTTFKTYCYCHG